MATINDLGQILARCRGCRGGNSRFEFAAGDQAFGVVFAYGKVPGYNPWDYAKAQFQYRLYRCVGCGMGALGVVRMERSARYPQDIAELVHFYPEAKEALRLPDAVPGGIEREFREAETCMETGCYRAAAALLRSALDKTLRSNGYKVGKRTSLKKQIDEAAQDGVLTEARKNRAHEDVRVLGNDILHEAWRRIAEEEVEACHRYVQRVLEDFYDDRESVLKLLAKANRRTEDLQDNIENH